MSGYITLIDLPASAWFNFLEVVFPGWHFGLSLDGQVKEYQCWFVE